MGFRDIFKKVAGERPHDETPPAASPPAERSPYTPSPAIETRRNEPRTEARPNERHPTLVTQKSDPMKLAQTRLAEKRRARLVVCGITKHGWNGYSGLFSPGQAVSLERDPANPYDPNAVKVLLSDGSMLGYVAREMATSVSRELADGWTFKVQISDVPYVEDKWGQCQLEVMDKNPPAQSEPKAAVTPSKGEPPKPYHSNRAFVPPLNLGDDWQHGKISAYTVQGLDWLYAYYPSHKSTSMFRILSESPGLIMDEEIRAAESIEGDRNGTHRIRALLVAFSIKDSATRAAEYLQRTGKLTGECAACCLDKLIPAISDVRTREFIATCIDIDSVNAVADKCWNINRAVLDKNNEVLLELAALGMKPRLGSFGTTTGKHTDFNIMYTSELHSPLSRAVDNDDIEEARYLISYGADVNQMMFNSGGRGKGSWLLYTQPVLMQVRSVGMYKLFVEAGAVPYPRSYTYRGKDKSDGEEHNLLDELWRGPAMSDAALELADYLVLTEYDMPLRCKIDEIKASFNREDEGPYKNNKSYVLEWCTMEIRAIAAAMENVKEIAKRDGHTHHSLSWDLDLFIGDWLTSGYEEALRRHAGEFSEKETPARYAYPERILKRGVQHGVS